jgi:hypothetical protein
VGLRELTPIKDELSPESEIGGNDLFTCLNDVNMNSKEMMTFLEIMTGDIFENDFYVPGNIATIKLLLRRTLVRSVINIIKVTNSLSIIPNYKLQTTNFK